MKHLNFWIRFVVLIAGLAAAGAQAQSLATTYPSRPVRMIIPYPPGGTTDVIGRMLAQKLSDVWHQPVVVENRAGAAGVVGSEYVARSPPDGYTLVMGSGTTHSSGPAVNPRIPYNNLTDFSPVSLVVTFPNMLLVSPSVPARTITEFIALLKANPGKYNFASSGVGGTLHLAAELFMMISSTKMVHVSYKGPSAATTDLLAGRVECEFDNMASGWPLAQSGQLRALGVTGLKRSPAAPDVPAIAEVLPGFEANSWVGLLMPAGVPDDIVRKFSSETRRVLLEPEFARKLEEMGSAPVGNTPEEFAAFIKQDTDRWRQVVKAAGIVMP
jgi:tripartite-type tricarboxylate transporter receptor subunit TctC